MIEVVAATRLSEPDFWSAAPLGLSLARLVQDDRIVARVTFNNRLGLPAVYNRGIETAHTTGTVVFVHDDVWIDDEQFSDRVLDGLRRFEVVGVAGNRRRVPGQPSWAFLNTQLDWDDRTNLSGALAHGEQPPGRLSYYGPAPAECELLDGVLMAAHRSTLVDHGLSFDRRFSFHFYDLDFCRCARQLGVRLGTWPVSLTHRSGGVFGTPEWSAAYEAYLAKWTE